MEDTVKQRAPFVVAKHFYDKYGHGQSVEMISMRLERIDRQHDTDFWLDVLRHLDKLAFQGLQGLESATEVNAEDQAPLN